MRMTDIKQSQKSWTLHSSIYLQILSLTCWHHQRASDCWKFMTWLVEMTTEGKLAAFWDWYVALVCLLPLIHTCNTRGQQESAHLLHPWAATNGIDIEQDLLYAPCMSVYWCEMMQLSQSYPTTVLYLWTDSLQSIVVPRVHSLKFLWIR